jgi:D-glycero-D-manno-heptose 1,7-bisphosphate phosphatase
MQPTLFLDRDGVINKRIVGSYVRSWLEFEFLEGALEALSIFSSKFATIVVVTNQQGIAKGVMEEIDLIQLHEQMTVQIQANGGRIDNIYYSKGHESTNPPDRKPNIGMAKQAKIDFPKINFDNAWMVGDSVSDIEFGIRLGMKTALVQTKKDIDQKGLQRISKQINWKGESLRQFAEEITRIL